MEIYCVIRNIQKICMKFIEVMDALEGCPTSQPIFAVIIDTIEQTANNYSSMYQVEISTSYEIDYITSYLLRQASEQGLVLPENNAFFNLLNNRKPIMPRRSSA